MTKKKNYPKLDFPITVSQYKHITITLNENIASNTYLLHIYAYTYSILEVSVLQGFFFCDKFRLHRLDQCMDVSLWL